MTTLRQAIARPFYKKFYVAVLALCLVIPLVIPGAAQAQDITEAGAEELKTVLQETLIDKNRMDGVQQDMVEYDGEIKVELAEGYYAVTMPHASVNLPDGKSFDIGIVSINAVPGPREGEWKMASAVPTPMYMYDKNDNIIGKMTIGHQQSIGIWNAELASYREAESTASDIVYDNPAEDVKISLDALSYTANMNKDEAGTWSGFSDFELNEMKVEVMSITDTGKPPLTVFAADSLTFTSELGAYDPQMATKFHEIYTQNEDMMENGAPQSMSKEHALGLYNLLFEVVRHSLNSMNTEITLNGIVVHSPDEQTGNRLATIDKLFFNMQLDGLLGNSASYGNAFGVEGVEVSGLGEETDRHVPEIAKFDLNLVNIPLKDLETAGRDILEQRMDNPDMFNISAAMMTKIMPLLSKAETSIVFEDNRIKAASYDASMTGRFTADQSAVMNIAGSATTKIRGMDQAIQELQAEINTAGPEKAKTLRKTLQGLTFMQMMGQADPDNPDTRIFKVELTKDGRMLLNGSDMSALMGKGGRQQQSGSRGGVIPPAPQLK